MEYGTLENDVVTNGFDGGVLHLLRVTRAQCHASVAFAALRKEDGSLDITSLPSAEEGSDWPSSTLEGIVRQTLEDPLIGDSKAVIRVSDVFRRLWHGERVHTRMAVAPLNDETNGEEPFGLLCALGPAGGQFSEADLDMLGRLALRFMNQVRARRQIMQGSALAEAEAAAEETAETGAGGDDTWFAAGPEPETAGAAAAPSGEEAWSPVGPAAPEPVSETTPAGDLGGDVEDATEPLAPAGEEMAAEELGTADSFEAAGMEEAPESADADFAPLVEAEELLEPDVAAEQPEEGALVGEASFSEEQGVPVTFEPESEGEAELTAESEFFSTSGGIFEETDGAPAGTEAPPGSPVAHEPPVKAQAEGAENNEVSPEDRIAALIEGPAPDAPSREPAPAPDGPERLAAFLRRLDEVLRDARVSNSPSVLIVIELAKQSGRLSADEVAAAANWLFNQTRFDDFVTRIASSTFAVVLPLRAMPHDLSALRRRFSEAAASAASELGGVVTSASSVLAVAPGDVEVAEDLLFRAVRQLTAD